MATFIVAGSPAGRRPAGLNPTAGDRVIAADRGGRHALAWGWPIHLLVGDLDSLPKRDAAAIRATGIPTVTAPAAKDETDLELALAQALARPMGVRSDAGPIIICAALGGRADHLLANALLLAAPELAGLDVMIAEGRQTLRLLRGGEELTLRGAAGDLLSLLPIGGDATGVTTAGLAYPLRDETLYLGRSRGVSNVFTEATPRVALRGGLLWVIHSAASGRN